MTAINLPNGKQQFFDANGSPLSLGTVEHYVPGTLTPKTTWSDYGQTSENSNPLDLDSAGRASIYGQGYYRQIVKDSDSNTIWDSVAAVSQADSVFVTPQQYGAVGDAVTDDTTALQVAINLFANPDETNIPGATGFESREFRGRILDLQGGTFLVTSPLDVTNCYGLTIQNGTLIAGGSSWSAGDAVIEGDLFVNGVIQNVVVECQQKCSGIHINRGIRANYLNVYVYGIGDVANGFGFKSSTSFSGLEAIWDNCVVFGTTAAATVANTPVGVGWLVSGGSDCEFVNCKTNRVLIGLDLRVNGWRVADCHFTGYTGSSAAGIKATSGQFNQIDACTFDQTYMYLVGGQRVSITDNQFRSDFSDQQLYAVLWEASSAGQSLGDATIVGNYAFLIGTETSFSFISLLESGGNYFSHVGSIEYDDNTIAGDSTFPASPVVQAVAYRKNWLVNGGCSVSQRGASFTSTGGANNDSSYTLDQMILWSDGNDIVDVGQLNLPGHTTNVGPNSYYGVNLLVATANKRAGIGGFIDSTRCAQFRGRKASFSFIAKKRSGNATVDKLRCAIIAWDGYGNAPTLDIISNWQSEGTNPSLVTNWEYVNNPADAALNNSFRRYFCQGRVPSDMTNIGWFVWIENDDGTVGDQVDLGEFQLELSEMPGIYECPDLVETEDICRRYFERLYYANTDVVGTGWVTSTTNANIFVEFHEKFKEPSLSYLDATDLQVLHSASSTTATAIAATNPRSAKPFNSALISVTVASGLTAGEGAGLRSNTSNTYIDVDAEFHA